MGTMRIASPCSESWDAMSPSSGGRHCARCAQDVHDLRFVTETTARARLALFGGSGRLCVRLRFDDAGQPVFRDETPPRRADGGLVAAAIAAVASAGCGASTTPPIETANCAPVAVIREVTVPHDAAVPRQAAASEGSAAETEECADGTTMPKGDCPARGRVIITLSGDMEILPQITFPPNVTVLSADTKRVLDAIGKTIQAQPQVGKVTVSGHASPDEAVPARVALRRAEIAVRYLVSNGVDPARLVARGAGSAEPRADNGTATGRAVNRRVELTLP